MGKRSSRTKTVPVPAPETRPSPADESKLVLPISAGLALLIAIIYAQLYSHQFLNYDDDIYITNNAHVTSGLTADALRWSMTAFSPNWHPLTWWTYFADVTLFGVRAAPMLYANVTLHIASTLLLFFFLFRTTKFLWRSATAAAIFAVHPLRVESVAWVSERKDVLCALFFFLAIWFYAHWAESKNRSAYIASLAMFAIGLMAKGMLITLPFVLILIDYWPLNRFDLKRSVLEKIPFFLVLIPGLGTTFLTQKKIKAIASAELFPLPERIANAVISYLAYFGKMLLPVNQAIPYPARTVVSPTDTFLCAIALLSMSAIAWGTRKRYPYVLIGWLWYLGMLVPVIGIVQIGSQSMADRYTYLPQVGLTFAIVWLAATLVRQRERLIAVAAIAISALTIRALNQTTYWKDSETLFRHSLATSERNHLAHTNLGLALLDQKRFDEAEAEFRAALAISPNDELARNCLATVLKAAGNTMASEQELRGTIAKNPNSVDAYRALGRQLLSSGRRDEAIPILEKAIALNADPGTRAALAAAKGKTDEAIALYRDAANANPKSAEAHNDLAAILARAGRDQEALAEYNEALQLDVHQSCGWRNRGVLLGGKKDERGAAAQFEAAAKERPKSPGPLVYLALIHAKGRRFDLAVNDVNAAIASDHDSANAQLTAALGLPPKATNIDEYLAWLGQQH